MNLIVAGSRYFNNYELVSNTIMNFVSNNNVEISSIKIVSGTCRGADSLGERFAIEHNIEILRFIPDWDKYGKTAGPIRNREMAKVGDYLLLFVSDKTNISSGSASMLKEAKKAGIGYDVYSEW